jgi:5-methylcytosine-specific restriction endonuclease McrA
MFISTNEEPVGWWAKRRKVYNRDNGMCRYCLKKVYLDSDCRENIAHIDHVVPKSLMGTDDIKNLVTSCAKCNLKKGQRTPGQAGMFMYETPITFTHAEYVSLKYSPDKNGSRIGRRPKRIS